MTQMRLFKRLPRALPPDITLGRHHGNARSIDANAKADPQKATMRERMRVFIHACGSEGATVKEIAETFATLPHKISGRATALKLLGQAFDSGREREGYTVLVSRAEWINASAEGRA